MGAQLHGFYSLPKPGKHQLPVHDDSPQEACYVLPRGYSSEAPAHSGLGEPELENEEVYTFKTPCNALATMHSNERPPDNYDLPTPPGSFYQIPRTFDKNHNALTPSSSESSCAPPPRPPKPSQGSEGQWGSPQSIGSQNGEVSSAVSVIPRRNTLPAVENIRLHRGTLNAISALTGFLMCSSWMLLVSWNTTSVDWYRSFEIAHFTCFLFSNASLTWSVHSLVVLQWLCASSSSPSFSFFHSFPLPLSLILLI